MREYLYMGRAEGEVLETAKEGVASHKSELFMRHPTIYLSTIFSLTVLIIYLYLNDLSNRQVHDLALKNVKVYTQVLTEFRSLYTSEVVVKAKSQGMTITHDYENNPAAIPLPATLSMLLGNKMGGVQSQVSSHLYSAYPFPWREEGGGLRDQFSQAAWQALRQFPDKPYYTFVDYQGKMSLRYASADVMRSGCVSCHNNHPDTPKDDWKEGDVRGVLEVIVPIELDLLSANAVIQQTLMLLVVILILALLGIRSVLSGLNKKSEEARLLVLKAAAINEKLEDEIQHRKIAQDQLLEISMTDGLTEVGNRRRFDQEFDLQWRSSRRKGDQLSLIMIDVDHFKAYNDNYGHQAGDKVLCQVAVAADAQILRASDLFCRYGGEEFVVLLADTNIEKALLLAEKVRQTVENMGIAHEFSNTAAVVTISLGVATVLPGKANSASELLVLADKALYQAKGQGRNRCSVSQ